MNELYISVDIEAGGPIPGPYSMFSLGAAAFAPNPNKQIEQKPLWMFSANLTDLEGSVMHPDTQKFWNENPIAYAECRKDQVDHTVAMHDFVRGVEKISVDKNLKPVFVGYPAGFDFTFVYWYMMKFVGRSPFTFSALDIKSYAMAKLGTTFRNTTKRNFPRKWFPKSPHTHIALDDAIEQGQLFMNILNHEVK